MTTLRTPRLELRPLVDPDAEELHDLFNDPDVSRYLLDGKRVSRDWVREQIESSGTLFDELGCGLWAVSEPSAIEVAGAAPERASAGARSMLDAESRSPELLSSDLRSPEPRSLLGVVGFRHFFDPAELQLLYALRPGAWGRGLATEAAAATLEHAFRTVGFHEVRAATDEPNVASIAVLERLGMRPWKVENGEPYRTLFYRLSAGDWASARGGEAGSSARK